jgi:hypothetical protein
MQKLAIFPLFSFEIINYATLPAPFTLGPFRPEM